MSNYNSGDFAKHQWNKRLHSTLYARANEFLTIEQQNELRKNRLNSKINGVIDYFKSLKAGLDSGDKLLIGSRFAMTMYAVALARQVTINYPNGKPSLLQRFKRDYKFTVRAKASWLASSGYSNPVAKFVRNLQTGSTPTNPILKETASNLKKYSTPASFIKHVTGFEKNRTAAQTVQNQKVYTVERSKKGVKEVASQIADAKGLKGVAKGIPIVGNVITVVSNTQEFTNPANADKSLENKTGRFMTGVGTDMAAAMAGAKVGAVVGSFGGPVGTVVGGAVGALVGVTISSKYGGKIKDIGGNAFEGAVKIGKNLTDNAGKAFKSIGSWFG